MTSPKPTNLLDRARARARSRGNVPDDRGESLIELLISLMVLGLAGLALISAFGTTIMASGTHRQLASIDAVMRSVAEEATAQLQQQPNPLYQSCGSAVYYNSVLNLTPPAGYTATITNVSYWSGASFATTCVAGSTAPQILTLQVSNGKYNDSIGFTIDDRGQINLPTVSLSQPQVTAVTPSSSTPGSVTVTFTGSANAPNGQTYTAEACTDTQMAQGCVTRNPFISGTDITGLVAGTTYYVVVVANGSTGYSAAASIITAPVIGTTQLNAPTGVALSVVTTTSESVSFVVSSNAPTGQPYTALFCTNSLMTTGCVGPTTVTAPSTITGLVADTTYYTTVSAPASTGYLPATSSVSPGVATLVQLGVPAVTSVVVATGGLAVSFTNAANAPSGQTYTALLCTNAAMTLGCVSSTIASGGVVTGLVPGASYYTAVTANASLGYLTATSPVAGLVTFNTQLLAPTGIVLGHGASAGSLTVAFTAPGNAPSGQLYTTILCTNSSMTTGCTAPASATSGGTITGLTQGATYYATVTALASSGYLTATSSASTGLAATTQLSSPTGVTLSDGTSNGSLAVSFTAPANAAAGQTYTTTLCTNAAMTTGCVGPTAVTSGASVSGLTAGTTYYATITASASPGYLVSPASAVSPGVKASTQLSAPTAVTLAFGASAGSLSVTFTASSNAPGGQLYTATLCTNSAMTLSCLAGIPILSGGTISGLTQGTTYYASISASPSAGYLAATSATSAGKAATVQLTSPTSIILSNGTLAGSLNVSFTAPANAASGQLYTTILCTNAAMTTGCTTSTAITNGGQITGLTVGTTYYGTVTASASTGYLASSPSAVSAGSKAATQLSAPTAVTLTAGTSNGSLTIAFTASSNAASGQLYTATLCTNSAMTTGCVGPSSITSGALVSGLVAGTTYYATVTASTSAGYIASAASAVSTAVKATTQLNAPTAVTLGNGTVAGSLTISFTAPANAASGQLYTEVLCTNSAMTTGCTASTAIVNGGQVTGLTQGTTYYGAVTASASAGYLVSPVSSVSSGLAATVQLTAATAATLTPGSASGSLNVSFTAPANAASGQLYTTILCTNAAMTTGCTASTAITSGGQVTGLTAGTTYYATVTALASAGYLVAPASAVSVGVKATTQLNAPTAVTLGHGASAGSLTVTFTASSNAAAGQLYTATLCTDAAMTLNCTAPTTVATGGTITGLTQAVTYYATVTASASTSYLISPASTTSSGLAATTQLASPTNTVLTDGVASGSLTVTFTASSNAASGQLYTTILCTNAAMTTGCTSGVAITSGGHVTGLVAGTTYYATVTASASAGYLVSPPSGVSGSAKATTQISAPTSVALGFGASGGSLTVTFTASANAASGQLYTTILCTNAAMTTGCTSAAAIASGGTVAGLTAGTSYYATVTALASTGYIASPASTVSAAKAATVQLGAPTSVALASGTVAGSLTVSFVAPSPLAAGQLYTTILCTNAAMTTGCTASTAVTNGGQVTGLVAGTTYYATVTASASAGYLVSPASSVSPGIASTLQMLAPTAVTLGYGTAAGSLTVSFTGSSNAPGGQTYTTILCTNAAMTTGCTAATAIISGGQVAGLTAGTTYYATVTAPASSGYLAATSAASAGVKSTIQLAVPTAVTLAYGTVVGSLVITYTAPANAAAGQLYTANFCTNAAMTAGCTGTMTVTTGAQVTGLVAGTTYYATVTASASAGYLVSPASTVSAGKAATGQVAAPVITALTTGTGGTGRMVVTFTEGGTITPSSYTALLCTNTAMTTGCVTVTNYVSGATVTGLVTATNYYATITAVAPAGDLNNTSTYYGPTKSS